jgi:transcriptional regulator of acetoin/glycerol metabolism
VLRRLGFDYFDTMTTRQRYTQKQIIDALKETKGMVYLAAKRLGCEAQTIYNYRDRYPAIVHNMGCI